MENINFIEQIEFDLLYLNSVDDVEIISTVKHSYSKLFHNEEFLKQQFFEIGQCRYICLYSLLQEIDVSLKIENTVFAYEGKKRSKKDEFVEILNAILYILNSDF